MNVTHFYYIVKANNNFDLFFVIRLLSYFEYNKVKAGQDYSKVGRHLGWEISKKKKQID